MRGKKQDGEKNKKNPRPRRGGSCNGYRSSNNYCC